MHELMHIPSDALARGETRPDESQAQTGEERQDKSETKPLKRRK